MTELVRCPYCREVIDGDRWKEHTRHHSTWLMVRTSWRAFPGFTALALALGLGLLLLAGTLWWLVRP